MAASGPEAEVLTSRALCPLIDDWRTSSAREELVCFSPSDLPAGLATN